MKILIITSSYPDEDHPYHGVFLPPLVDELIRNGCNVALLTQSNHRQKGSDVVVNERLTICRFGWKGAGIPVSRVFSKGIVQGFRLINSYFGQGMAAGRKLARDFGPDIIHAEWFIPSGLLAQRISHSVKKPYTVRSLGSDVLVLGKKTLFKPFIRFTGKRAHACFADGFGLSREVSRITGRDCAFVATTTPSDEYKNIPFPETGETFNILTIGRLHPVKGQDVLIDAIKIASDQGINIKATLAGEGPMYRDLMLKIDNLDLAKRVFLTGKISNEEIVQILSEIHAVVIPSRSESIPLVLAEALQAAKPLIVSDAGDMGMLVQKYGLGLVFHSGDSRELAGCLLQMASVSDRSDYGIRANELLEILNVKTAAATLLEYFKKAVK